MVCRTGFQTASADDLPAERLQEYNANGRNSKVFVYDLQVRLKSLNSSSRLKRGSSYLAPLFI